MEGQLEAFLPATRQWFQQRYGQPTRAQSLGWPAIQRGENTLILSPTGSGKTLAAFLWGIDRIYVALARNPQESGVLLLYVSPLKALNNDIALNLQEPLRGIHHTATMGGETLPAISTAVRTGDTPASERQRMVRNPPHILITTPESLYLLLTSPQARRLLAPVESVIVDEIHTLVGNKRGVHLALSLERLESLAGHPVQRIGLSATQRPLDEVARFVGGQVWIEAAGEEPVLAPRPVTVVNAGVTKPMDLQVVTPVADLRRLPGGSIWPALVPRVLDEIRRHDTTLVFANSRRAAERAADRLNEQYAREAEEEVPPGSPEGLLVDGVPRGQGWAGTGRVGGPFRAHHGSVSRAVRLELEQALKSGELAALIATSSLELGIDIGSVDAVLQLQSPRGISRGLQRIGRAGHLVGQTSYGRIYVTHREDLLDAGAVAHGMLQGDIEPTRTPQNCLDVLAQQIVAMVSVEPQKVDDVFRLVRQAYGYERLSRQALQSVLKMISGGYSSEAYRGLRPSVEWDRVNNVLLPLPGTRLLAIRNGGTIPDRGEFRVVLADGHTSLGTLDEEFVFETHVGDVFALGTNTWRVMSIDEDRMVVADAAGAMPRMPFWRGELPKREYHMGLALGAFRRQLAERVADLGWVPEDPRGPWPSDALPVLDWLSREYAMDDASARNAVCYVGQQLSHSGAISSDNTIVLERFTDALGDERLVIHSCFGARINSVWAMALIHAFRERLGTTVDVQVNDDAILFRLLEGDREPPLDVIRHMGAEEARERVLRELPNSALFGAQFRMNAARALVLPRVRGAGRRTPFWLQRLRARDLLAISREWDDFPLVAETYRDCLRDVLDIEHLGEMLDRLAAGEIRIVETRTLVPSPVAAGLVLEFAGIHLYDGDTPRLERQMQALSINRELLADLLDDGTLAELLRPDAIEQVERELQHLADGYRARTLDELAVMLRELGDLTDDEVMARSLGDSRAWLEQLAHDGRVERILLPRRGERWVSAEHLLRYRIAFALAEGNTATLEAMVDPVDMDADAARMAVLRHMLRTHGPLTLDAIVTRYDLPPDWLEDALESLAREGVVLRGRLAPGSFAEQWCDRNVLERLHRETLSQLRREVRAVPLPDYACFLPRWQGLYPAHHPTEDPVLAAIGQLAGQLLPAEIWERDVLPLRVPDYAPATMDRLCAEGALVWQAQGSDWQHLRVRFFWTGEGNLYVDAQPEPSLIDGLLDDARRIYEFMRKEGSVGSRVLQSALGLAPQLCDRALLELVMAGLVTHDRPEVLRAIIGGRFGIEEGEGIRSSLDDQMAEWRDRNRPTLLQRPGRSEMLASRRRVARRLTPRPPAEGRWSIVHRYGVLGEPLDPVVQAQAQARQALHCYGIITRDIIEGQRGMLPWAALYPHLYRMELTGEVRRGYFVQGLSGLQYALPEAVDELRAWSRADAPGRDALVLINAADPALIYGRESRTLDTGSTEDGRPDATATGPSFSRIPSNYVVLENGVPVLVYEHGSGRWQSVEGIDGDCVARSVSLLLSHITRPGGIANRPRRVLVNAWNGRSPLNSPIGEALASLGFRRETPGMVWDGLVGGSSEH